MTVVRWLPGPCKKRPPLQFRRVQQVDLQNFTRDIAGAMLRDQQRGRALVRSIEHAQRHGRPFDRMVERLGRMLEESRARRAWREQNRPRPKYPQELPVVAR